MILVENLSNNEDFNEDEHIKKIHDGLEQKRHEYGSCGKSCSESRNLNQHINTIHVEQRNFKNIVKNL